MQNWFKQFCQKQIPKVYPNLLPYFVLPEKEIWFKINTVSGNPKTRYKKYFTDNSAIKKTTYLDPIYLSNMTKKWAICFAQCVWKSFYVRPLHSFENRVFRFSERIRELATIFIASSEFHFSGANLKLWEKKS